MGQILMETWVEKKTYDGKNRLPRKYVWGYSWRREKTRREELWVGMIMGLKRDLAEEKVGEEGEIMVGKVKCKKDS